MNSGSVASEEEIKVMSKADKTKVIILTIACDTCFTSIPANGNTFERLTEAIDEVLEPYKDKEYENKIIYCLNIHRNKSKVPVSDKDKSLTSLVW